MDDTDVKIDLEALQYVMGEYSLVKAGIIEDSEEEQDDEDTV